MSSRNFYDRSAVPVGEEITLEAQFKDSAGNPKDTSVYPSVQILDAATSVVRGLGSSGVTRTACGRYRLTFIVPDGYTSGMWNDRWLGTVDGYSLENIFDFTVNSVGSIEATGSSVPEVEYSLTDDDLPEMFSQEEIKGILRMRKFLKTRMRSSAYKPDGTPCPVLPDDQLNIFLCIGLAEFNATPTFTSIGFDDLWLQTIAVDVITQGAMLAAWASQAVIEAGFEFTINDNGVVYTPPPVSSMISSMYSAQLGDYRAKLKEIKRNIRPGPIGLGAGSLLVVNPVFRRLRHLKERRII